MISNNIDTKYSRSQMVNLNKVFFATNAKAKIVIKPEEIVVGTNEPRGRIITTPSPMLFFSATFISRENQQRWFCPALFSKIGNPEDYTSVSDSALDVFFNPYTLQTSDGQNCYFLFMNSGSYDNGTFFFYGADSLIYRQFSVNQNLCIDIENILYGITTQNETELCDLLYSYVPD